MYEGGMDPPRSLLKLGITSQASNGVTRWGGGSTGFGGGEWLQWALCEAAPLGAVNGVLGLCELIGKGLNHRREKKKSA